ncbi:hypothetical protein OCAE111667_12970 [Occultella aeris]|uniref:Uncharacterized protein n=1 Tax=Occultella aeris TaxID=2761496 RepID=A0A7M4DDZ2_9MICO|nr:hypothetical protein [Occultella aeris]VZO35106.1 hypothetical protein HALOF300_00332 [Occultella aeris]
MDQFWGFVGSFWWLAFPLAGIVGGWIKGAQKWDEKRRHERYQQELELERIRHGQVGPVGPGPVGQAAPGQVGHGVAGHGGHGRGHAAHGAGLAAGGQPAAGAAGVGRANPALVFQRDVDRIVTAHDDVNRRWLDYELDVAKLIDFPLMSDMREPLTVDFHRAKRDADFLRPEDPKKPDELRDPARLAEYREAVRTFEVAFDVAEREAKRRRLSDFSESERSSLARARKLIAIADDNGATHAERQVAYRRAKSELEGLIVLPDVAMDAMEQRIAGALDAAPATGGASPLDLGNLSGQDPQDPNAESGIDPESAQQRRRPTAG